MPTSEDKRRLPTGSGNKLFAAGIALLLGVAFPVAAFISFSSEDNAVTIIAICCIFGALFLAIGYWATRRVFPPRAKHLRLTLESARAQRGGEIAARLEVLDADDAGERVEVGLVCTEYYDVWQTNNSSSGSSRSRTTKEAVAHEEWLPADRAQRLQTISFAIPVGAPFSFKGDCLAYEWQLAVREPRRMRFDRREIVQLEVAP